MKEQGFCPTSLAPSTEYFPGGHFCYVKIGKLVSYEIFPDQPSNENKVHPAHNCSVIYLAEQVAFIIRSLSNTRSRLVLKYYTLIHIIHIVAVLF
jgi:hypothetical protein